MGSRVGDRPGGQPWVVVPCPGLVDRVLEELPAPLPSALPPLLLECSALHRMLVSKSTENMHSVHYASAYLCFQNLPMGVEARVQGRTMEVEVPIRPRSSQTFQPRRVLIDGTQQPWGDPIRLGSSQTFQPRHPGETLRWWELSCCLRPTAILEHKNSGPVCFVRRQQRDHWVRFSVRWAA